MNEGNLTATLRALHLGFRDLGSASVGSTLGLNEQCYELHRSSLNATTHLGLLLLVLLGLLLSLCLMDSGSSCRQTLLCCLVSPGGNGSKVGTDDTTLVLHGLARPLLGNLLRDTLLVHATVCLSPGDLARVLALQE